MNYKKLKQKARDLIATKCGDESPKDIHYVDVINLMMEFAKQMCELQKQECADSAFVSMRHTTWDINPDTNERYTDEELKAKYKDSNAKIHIFGNGGSKLYFVNKSSITLSKNICEI